MTPCTSLHGSRAHQWRTPSAHLCQTQHARRERLPTHAHDRCTACFVLRGGFRERHSRRVLDCGPATLVWRPPGTPHDDAFGDEGALCFNLEVAPELIQDVPDPMVAGPRGAWAVARLVLTLRAAGEVEPLDVEEGVVEIVHAIRQRETTAAPRHVQRAIDLLAERATEPWSLADVAREIGLHPMHLARAFRRARGESLGQFVRRRRVEVASTLLARSGRPLADVALAAGFADQSHMTRVFRRVAGITPGRFRAALRSFKT